MLLLVRHALEPSYAGYTSELTARTRRPIPLIAKVT